MTMDLEARTLPEAAVLAAVYRDAAAALRLSLIHI